MLTKFLIATVVFLELIKVPNAQDKVSKWAFSVFKRPLVQDQQITANKQQSPLSVDFNNIAPLPYRNPKIKDPIVAADGAIVIDIATSKILYQKNPQKKLSMASLTKIMTALISLENYKLTDIVTVPKDAPLITGAKINLRGGEKLTVESTLYGLLLYSGNDAAYSLASKMGEDKFVSKMNQKAKDLGLLSIHYGDPTGLSEHNKTTIRDLGFFAVFALKNPKFAQIVSTNETTISSTDGRIQHPLKNTNRLLRDYPGTFGVKTGYTEEAGHCLISAVERGGHKVLVVDLDNPGDQFKESRYLLDWTFSAYTW